MNITFLFIIAFLLTVLIEFIVAAIYIKKDPLIIFLAIFLINLITNPIMNYLYIYESVNLVVLETAVIAVESILITPLLRLPYLRALMLSIIMNLLSFGLGSLIMQNFF